MKGLTVYAETAKKLPSLIYKIGAQAYIRKTYPRHIFVETTASCQLRCRYCPRERTREDMDYSIFQAIVREATSFGPTSFSLHLFGEPLLWPHLIDGIKFIKHCNKQHVVLVTTNGLLLDEYTADLLNIGVDEIIWSWREEAKFKAVTKRWLKNATLHGKTKFRVRIIKEVTPKEAWEEWKTWPEIEVRSLHNYGGNIDISRWSETDGSAPKNLPIRKEKRWPCYHLWLAPAVAWNGEILLCCSDPRRVEPLGRFPDLSVAEAWQGERIKQIRNSHLRGEYSGICKNCDVWKNYPNFFFGFQRS